MNMQEVNVGIIGLGNVGSSTLAILAENGDQIAFGNHVLEFNQSQ